MKTVDVGAVLDEGEWSGYQKLLVLGTALAIILDGLDNQLLGAAVGGFIGDRVGRRTALIGSVLAFGILTVLVSFAGSIGVLGALRLFAGLGLGGAMPNAAALSSEYVPMVQRPFAVTLTIVCIPLGGSLAGFL